MNKEQFIATLQACYFGDKGAFNKILGLYEENQKLKKENDFLKADNIHIRRIRDNLLNENHKLETVLDEIREYIETKLRDVNLTYGIDNEFRQEYDDLLQILDKAKNE